MVSVLAMQPEMLPQRSAPEQGGAARKPPENAGFTRGRPVLRTVLLAAAAAERHHSLVASEVVQESGALAGRAGEETVEAAGGAGAAAGSAGHDERVRVGQAGDGRAAVRGE